MSTVKNSYATAANQGTMSVASLTSGQGRRGAANDNSSTLALDHLWTFGILIGTFTAPARYDVYGYASADDGSNYETGGSTDAAWNTIRGDEKFLGTCNCYTNTTTFWCVGTYAHAYRRMPRNAGYIISQTNCGTLSSTEGNHTKKFQALTLSVA